VAPAGYAGYSTGPIGQVPLKRVRGLARWVTILVIATGLMSFVDLIVRQTVTDEADEYLAGEISAQEFTDAIIGYSVVPVISFLCQVATLVLTIIWMFRVAANHRSLHRGGTWGPGWAIAGWVLPPFVFVIPTLMTVEFWKASDPDVQIGGDWRSRVGSPLPVIWGLLYSGAWIMSLVANADSSFSLSDQEETLAEGITSDPTLDIVVALLMLAAAIAFALLVRQITARHTRLTGEAHS
jgi:hypothetical protein